MAEEPEEAELAKPQTGNMAEKGNVSISAEREEVAGPPREKVPAEGSAPIARRSEVVADGETPRENVLAVGSAPVERIRVVMEEEEPPREDARAEDARAEDSARIASAPAVESQPTKDAVRLDELVREIRPKLLAVALRLTRGNRAEAEDLAQEALARGVKNFPPRGKGGSYEAWFITILRNLFLDECKRRKNRPVTASIDKEQDVPAPVPEEIPIWARVTREQLERAIKALPEKYRQPYLLKVQGKSYNDIAAELGIPRNTVGTRLREARSRLKKFLLKEVDRA